MKKILLLLIITQFSFAQTISKKELNKKMGKELCEDIKDKKFTKENFEMVVGISLLKVIKNNKESVEKHYGKNMYGEGGTLEIIGEELGEQMVEFCPDVFEKMYDSGSLDKYFEEAENELIADSTAVDEEYEDEPALIVSGKFTGSKIDGFLVVSVKEDSGKQNNFILLDKFENSFLITDKVIKLNEKIDVEYYETELFNPKTNSFVNYKIIANITKI